MITLQGVGASAGIAKGKIRFLKDESLSVEKRRVDDAGQEVARFNNARDAVAEKLTKLAKEAASKIGEENALLFEVHNMMLHDSDFTEPIIAIIETENVCAEYAVKTAGYRLAQDFSEMDDDYMKERSADIRDISNRLIEVLLGLSQGLGQGEEAGQPEAALPAAILAARDFAPSETARMDRANVLALISQEGAFNSHTAIFARTMGIPAIVALGDALSPELSGKDAILDGQNGLLYIEPHDALVGELEERAEKDRLEKAALENLRGKPTVAKNGREVKLFANIGSPKDADAALAQDAEGIGLFRSEFLYLGRDDFPDEETQFNSYKEVLCKMAGRQVIIRTLDIGADKQAAYFDLPKEENPALGLRAIRICLSRPDIFKTQLRAIYRASAYGNAAIMFPMINSLGELMQAREIAKSVRYELGEKNIPFQNVPIGIMIETPASAVISDILAEQSDFFSIGTNDLTQYTLAIDRQNASLDPFCDTHHEAILRLIRTTCENAHKAGIWCGICGSLGGDLALTKTFVEMGIDELSVEPSLILKLRSVIAGC
ncbi:MAG: phosphoenolpyruvate--protein phosphotransferase [Spirochaetes bacterium]|nr:phosphoenolpyruvate--protein phosphotransferase [Spirochaetota bacterium]